MQQFAPPPPPPGFTPEPAKQRVQMADGTAYHVATDQPPAAAPAIGPRGTSFVERLEDAKNKLLYEGVPSIGMPPLTSGVSQRTAEAMGSPVLGPIETASGVTRLLGSKAPTDIRPYRQRAAQGGAEVLGGAFQTAQIPLAATTPAFIPAVTAMAPVQAAAEKATSYLPVSPETKQLLNIAAPVAAFGVGMRAAEPGAFSAKYWGKEKPAIIPPEEITKLAQGAPTQAPAPTTATPTPPPPPQPLPVDMARVRAENAALEQRPARQAAGQLADQTIANAPVKRPTTPEVKWDDQGPPTQAQLPGPAPRTDTGGPPLTVQGPPAPISFTPDMREQLSRQLQLSNMLGEVERGKEAQAPQPSPFTVRDLRPVQPKPGELDFLGRNEPPTPTPTPPVVPPPPPAEPTLLQKFAKGEEGYLDTDRLRELAAKGADLIVRLGADRKVWTASMVQQFGEGIRPHLDRLYTAALQQSTGRRLEEAVAAHPDYATYKSPTAVTDPSPHGWLHTNGEVTTLPFDRTHNNVHEAFPPDLHQEAVRSKGPLDSRFSDYFMEKTGAARFRVTPGQGLDVSFDPRAPRALGLIDSLKQMASKYGNEGIRIEDTKRPNNNPVNIGPDFIERFGPENAALRAANETRRMILGTEPSGTTLGSGFGALQPLYDKVATGAKGFKDSLLPEISDRWQHIRGYDPAFANAARVWANAVPNLAENGKGIAADITRGLSPDQSRLLSLWADSESRENLRINHPEEYAQARSDPAIQQAMVKYKPHMDAITQIRVANGGEVLPDDYLMRVFDQQPWLRSRTSIDDFITRRNERNVDRVATAEQHYQIGDHDFAKAFTKKYVTENLISAKNRLFDTFANNIDADQHLIAPGDPMPPFIDYKGKRFFSPETMRQARGYVDAQGTHPADTKLAQALGIDKTAEAYGVYDPNAARSFGKASPQLRPELKESSGYRLIGPRSVVDVLNGMDARDPYRMDPFARWYRSQILGVGFPIHVENILRRVGQEAGGPMWTFNPKAWTTMYRTLMNPELMKRAQDPLDPAAMALREQGSYPSSNANMGAIRDYWGGNANPANWLVKANRFGHKMLFDPNFLGGLGGIDQRARIELHDMLLDRYPDKNATQIASAVDDVLAQYNQTNWTDFKRRLAPYLVFPGWDASSMRYVLQHPFKTTVPSALMVLLANQASYRLGQATRQDAYDPFNVHIAGRSMGMGLVREPLGNALVRAPYNALSAAAQGENVAGIESAAARGLQSSARQAAGMLHPAISAVTELGLGAKDLFGGDIANRESRATGEALPNFAKAVGAHAFPLTSRFMDEGGGLDWLSGVGSSLGVPNYAAGPDVALKRELSRASGVKQALEDFGKTDPARAREFKADNVNRLYLRAYPQLRDAVKALDEIDDAKKRAQTTLKGETLDTRLKFLDVKRDRALQNAAKLTGRLFDLKSQGASKPAPAVSPVSPNAFLSSPSM